MCLFAESSLAQLQRTITVDPSGRADFTTIQDAIDSIADNPAEKWTILLYAGEYDEAVTLGGTRENIDLIGVDRDAVIIAPTGTGENGLTITSGTEASRDNTIRHITIRTTDGHGIEIKKGAGGGDQTPRDIVIEDCVVEADGEGKDGIRGVDASLLPIAGTTLISSCVIESKDGSAVRPGNEWRISSSLCRTTGTNIAASRDSVGVGTADDVAIISCTLESVARCVISSGERTLIKGSILFSAGAGGPVKAAVVFNGAIDPRVYDTLIVCDATGTSQTGPRGVFLDSGGVLSGTGLLVNSTIHVIGGESSETAVGVQIDHTAGPLIMENCQLVVDNSAGTMSKAEALGIEFKCGSGCASCIIIGGSIRTTSGREKESNIYDLIRPLGNQELLYVSGTRFSKWHGPIKSAERRRSTVQRVLDVSPADADALLPATTLTTGEQEITTGLTGPDVYRVVTVTGSLVGMTQDVYIIGTDFAGNRIAEMLTLGGVSTIEGNKPFATVTKVILPAKNTQLIGTQTVSIGIGKKLGLYFPIGDSADVIQVGRMASAANQYTVEDLSGFPVEEIYSTVAPDTITNGDSFEFVVLATQ